jgi:hypothetical protein
MNIETQLENAIKNNDRDFEVHMIGGESFKVNEVVANEDGVMILAWHPMDDTSFRKFVYTLNVSAIAYFVDEAINE